MRAGIRKVLNWTVRLAVLALAVGLALAGPLPAYLARWLDEPSLVDAWPAGLTPAASVVGWLASAVGRRGAYLRVAALVAPLLVLGLAAWRGRLFCRWICPLGTVYALPARLSFRRLLIKRPKGGYVFWAIAGMALAGAPVLLFLDPLATFNRLTPLARGTVSAAGLALCGLVALFLVLGFVQPRVWCTHLCPLGYCFDGLRRARRRLWPGGRSRKPKAVDPRGDNSADPVQLGRREVLAGLLVGLPLGAALRFGPRAWGKGAPPPVLPPGAESPETFAGLCSRCYACVNVCPTRVIRPRGGAGRPLLEAFAPALDTSAGYCEEFCTNCTHVCPTGAIRPLTEEVKHARQIGTAAVIQDACLAWEDGEYCMVCQEYCPFFAVEADYAEDGVPRPVVNTDRCRGCGACESECPAVRKGKAIKVTGVDRQRRVPDPSP